MATIIVNTVNEDNNSGNTTVSLREAIALANSGDIIEFDPLLSGDTIQLSSELTINKNLTINGDIDGDDTTRDITISGNGDAFNIFNINDGDNANDSTVAIAGLTITNGNRGIVNYESLTLSNATISSHASQGIVNLGSLTIANSEIANNLGTGLGNYNNASFSLQNSTITANAGSGISVTSDGSTAIISNSQITDNTLSGISLNNGTLEVTDTTIADNDDRGLFIAPNSTTTITNSTIADNTATGIGGGIYNLSNNLTVVNSTITGNSSGASGGGIYNLGAMTLANSTVANNYATVGDGGGIANLSNGSLTLRSTIVADNTTAAGDNDLDNPDSGTINAFQSLIETNADQINGNNTNNITGVDPLLDPNGLADNGGLTQTIALQVDSPAINAGSNPNNLTTDQRGSDRVSGAATDIGAYEVELPTGIVVTTTDDEVNGISDGDISLREALGAIATGGTIRFADSLNGSTITLNGSALAVTQGVTIDGDLDGDGTADITIDANQQSRVFNIDDGDNDVDATVEISGLTITGGNVTGTGIVGAGGGIYNRENLTLTDSTLSNNSAATFGGGVFNINASLNLANSTVSGNSASNNGGGIYNVENATATITNSTVSGNSAGFGGGIGNALSANLTLNNSTVTGNSASQGGGLVNSQSTITLTSSLISGNQADTAAELSRISGSVTANGNNLFGHDGLTHAEAFRSFNPGAADIIATSTLSDGSANPDATALTDILDTTLQDNGGPTQTHALVAGSPAIDTGSNPNNLEFDQRGVDRLQGSSVDIGAFESAFTSGLPDLVATAFDVVDDHVLLGQATLNYTLENLGNLDASSFTVNVVYSDDATIDSSDTVVNSFTVDLLTAGGSLSSSVDLQLPVDVLYTNALAEDPPNLGSGYISQNFDYVGLVIDPSNTIAESDELNNSGQGQGTDVDDITYFPWDLTGSTGTAGEGDGIVNAVDGVFVFNRLGQDPTGENAFADLNGDGVINAVDGVAVFNRLGYSINNDVFNL